MEGGPWVFLHPLTPQPALLPVQCPGDAYYTGRALLQGGGKGPSPVGTPSSQAHLLGAPLPSSPLPQPHRQTQPAFLNPGRSQPLEEVGMGPLRPKEWLLAFKHSFKDGKCQSLDSNPRVPERLGRAAAPCWERAARYS